MSDLAETPVRHRKTPIFRSEKSDRNPIHSLLRLIWIWLSFIIALWASWHLLAKVDFGYALWYEVGGVKQNIAQYAPENRYKKGFEETDKAQRLQLFHQIVLAIQSPPEQAVKQLQSLRYQTADGTSVKLLRPAEVLHLVDVSYLVQRLNAMAQSLALIWIGLSIWFLLRKVCFPNSRQMRLSILAGLGILGILLIAFGPTEVFYQLHRWVFPEGHPWFFYYQDSLMSTMMYAPVLFGEIGLLLLGVSLLLFLAIWQIFKPLACKRP
jgi:hypothetical protein